MVEGVLKAGLTPYIWRPPRRCPWDTELHIHGGGHEDGGGGGGHTQIPGTPEAT